MPKRRAASRWLSPSTWQAWRTRAYSSTAFILTLPAVRTGRKIRRRLFPPPPRPDTPAASVRDFLSAAYTRRGTAAARPATREVRIGGTAVVGIGRSQREGWRGRAPPHPPQPAHPPVVPRLWTSRRLTKPGARL